MASRPDDRHAGPFHEHPSYALPVFVAGPSGLETYRASSPDVGPERPEPDWRMATVPLLPRDPLQPEGVRPDTAAPDGRRRLPGGWHPSSGPKGWSGPRVRRPEHRSRLGRRAVLAIVAVALAAGILVGAGVTLLAHHGAERSPDTSALSVNVVTVPGYRSGSGTDDGSGSAVGPDRALGGFTY